MNLVWTIAAVTMTEPFEKKRGDTLVRTLREDYGPGFASGVRGDMKLDTLLDRVGANSLTELFNDYRRR